tara:strand:- start:4873 stop:5496 length:624 start_codon:yes stop_codon:yes gene_type:complete
MSVDLTPLALPALLAAGAALTLISARTALPGPISLTTSLLAAALLTGAYFFAIDHLLSAMAFALAAGAGAAAAAIDARRQLLPDVGAGLIALAGLASAISRDALISALIAGAISAVILIAAALLTRKPGRDKTLGDGDILLAGACGFWLAPEQVPYALLCATILTAASGFATRMRTGEGLGRMAFGPGLIAGYGLAATGFLILGSAS